MIKKRIALGAVLVAALCAGTWLLVSPSLNHQSDLERQGELLDSISAQLPAFVAIDSDMETQGQGLEPVLPDDEALTDGYLESEPDIEPQIHDEPNEPEEPAPLAQAIEPLDHADFPNGITPIGIMRIERIDLRLPVMEGVDVEDLRIAPGRVPQTANVGEIGNAVIAGHRNYTFGSMFNRLDEVAIGDAIVFQAMSGEEMEFEVFEIQVIAPDDQIAFIQPQNESIITLYTCTPVREATHRLLVRARKI